MIIEKQAAEIAKLTKKIARINRAKVSRKLAILPGEEEI